MYIAIVRLRISQKKGQWNWDLLEDILEDAMTPKYVMSGEKVSLDEAGNPRMVPKWTVRYWNLHGEYVEAPYNYATQEEIGLSGQAAGIQAGGAV